MFEKNIIKNYCIKHDMFIKTFADRLHEFEKINNIKKTIKINMLYLYNQARRKPSMRALNLLEKITNGEINYYSFVEKDAPLPGEFPEGREKDAPSPISGAGSSPANASELKEPFPINPNLREASNE
jgi:hypothetical protein